MITMVTCSILAASRIIIAHIMATHMVTITQVFPYSLVSVVASMMTITETMDTVTSMAEVSTAVDSMAEAWVASTAEVWAAVVAEWAAASTVEVVADTANHLMPIPVG